MLTNTKINLRQLSPLKLIITLTILQLAIALLCKGFVLSFDEAIWHYIGRNWFRNGLVPYAGGADNKSPFIFALFGLSDWLFGVNYWFVRIIGTLCQSVSIYYVYKITKKLAGHDAGLVATSIFGLSLLWHFTGSKYVAFTETFEVMFLIIAFYKYLTARNSRELMISGLMAGLAVDFRLTACFGMLAIMIVLIRERQLKKIAAFAIGVVGGACILLIFCLLWGIELKQLFINCILDNFGHGSITSHPFSTRLNDFCDKFIYSPMVIFYPLIIAYAFIVKKFDVIILWCTLMLTAICIIGLFDVVHIRERLPPLAIMNSVAIMYIANRWKISFNAVLIMVWVLFFPSLSEPFESLKELLGKQPEPAVYGVSPYINPSESDRKLLGKWVKAHTKPTDLVFVHSFGTQVQAYSERISPTIYFSITQTNLAEARLRNDLKLHRPAMILIPMFTEYTRLVNPGIRKFVADMVTKDYYLDRSLYNYQIFKLKR